MPTYDVRLVVNVPGLGARTVDQVGIVAASMEEAIRVAIVNITIAPTQVVRTAP